MKQRVVAIILLAALGVLATQCAPAPQPAAAPTQSATKEGQPAAASGSTLKIGFFSPTTGPLGVAGNSSLAGAKLGVKLVNDAGGVIGRKIELITYDDGSKPEQAVEVSRKLAEQDKVVAAISGSISATTRAAASVWQEAGIPMLSAYAVHPEITKVGDKVFRVGMMGTMQGAVGAEVVSKELKAKKVAILIVDNDFGTSLTEGFKKRAATAGLEVVFEQKYPQGETEFRPIISKLAAVKPDVVYATGYYNEASKLIPQAIEQGFKSQIVGQEGYDSNKFIELTGASNAEGVVFTTDLNRDSARPATQRFLKEFKAANGFDPDMVGASGFDSVQILAYALKTAGGTDPKAIANAIAGIKNLEDVATGPFLGYTPSRDVIRPVTTQIVKGGAFHAFKDFADLDLVTAK